MNSPIVWQGLELMVFGMGLVFGFLFLLVALIQALTMLFSTSSVSNIELLAEQPDSQKLKADRAVSPLTLAIIQSAIADHRRHNTNAENQG